MSQAIEVYIFAREEALAAALDALRAERKFTDPRSSVIKSGEADAAFAVAARKLARAVGDLPAHMKPKGWEDGTPGSGEAGSCPR
jgi:hypothetical protein